MKTGATVGNFSRTKSGGLIASQFEPGATVIDRTFVATSGGAVVKSGGNIFSQFLGGAKDFFSDLVSSQIPGAKGFDVHSTILGGQESSRGGKVKAPGVELRGTLIDPAEIPFSFSRAGIADGLIPSGFGGVLIPALVVGSVIFLVAKAK